VNIDSIMSKQVATVVFDDTLKTVKDIAWKQDADAATDAARIAA